MAGVWHSCASRMAASVRSQPVSLQRVCDHYRPQEGTIGIHFEGGAPDNASGVSDHERRRQMLAEALEREVMLP